MTSERKPRKSVAFSDGNTLIDSHGEVTETNGTSDKASAESHSTGMFAETFRLVVGDTIASKPSNEFKSD